ncbi:MAG: hypothetical protein HZC51_08285 [Nitrospirae bacterium]|nr:hypothetical protein [Nitrospirota bacterium]
MLSQDEADFLLALNKKAQNDNDVFDFPNLGASLVFPVVSLDERESFLVDVNRSRMILSKCTFMGRYHSNIVLARLDISGPPHTNPNVAQPPADFSGFNGHQIPCPHLHLFVEGYDDKWAMPAPADTFNNTDNLHNTLDNFLSFFNVTEPPVINAGLPL